MPLKQSSKWLVYILELSDGTYYTGITTDIVQRVKAHSNGRGSKYVYTRLPIRAVAYMDTGHTRSTASRAECRIKSMRRNQKEKLIQEYRSKKMSEVFPIQPTFDRVFVKKDEAEQTKSGFHLPETIKGRSPTGTVVAVGPGRFSVEYDRHVPIQFKVGDRVFVKQFDGYTITYGSHTVHVFAEHEILGKIVGEEVEELSGGESNVGA